MTFLNPLILLGLIAASIPILLHLLNQRSLRTIEFSSLRFLKELQKHTIRKIQLRQWLLLAIRTLIIVCITLAFARPALRGTLGFGGQKANSSIVIVIDDSPSMSLSNESGRYIDQAKRKAIEIVSLLKEGDEAAIMPLSWRSQMEDPVLLSELNILYGYINDIIPQPVQHDISSILRITSRILEHSNKINKEVYVITDGQRSSMFHDQNTVQSSYFKDDVMIYFVPLSTKEHSNIAIERCGIQSSIFSLQEPIRLQGAIKNYGNQKVSDLVVGLYINNIRVQQKTFSIEPNQLQSIELTFIPETQGFQSGFLEIEDDDFPDDNRFYFNYFIPRQVNILTITQKQNYSTYINAGIDVFNEDGNVRFNNRNIAQGSLSSSALQDVDVVILGGIDELGSQQLPLFEKFMTDGGGLIFFPSEDSSISVPRENMLRLLRIENIQIMKSSLNMSKIEKEHPIFTNLFQNDIDEPRILNSFPRVLVSWYINSKNVQPLLTLNNNIPFLWTSSLGRGTIFGFSVPATPLWSELPFNAVFIPLLHQTIQYLAGNKYLTNSTAFRTSGEPVTLSEREFLKTVRRAGSTITVTDPKGIITTLQSLRDGIGVEKSFAVYQFQNTFTQGTYTVMNAMDTLTLFSINMKRTESDPHLITSRDLSDLRTHLGIQENQLNIIAADQSITREITQSRYGTELWKIFVAVALILAVLEFSISRGVNKEKL